MSTWKRAAALVSIAIFLAASLPSPVLAVSTGSEIKIGQDAAKQVDAENVIISDPVLNNWVRSIGDSLSKYRARPDINYQVKIIDTNDINAFSLPGGFVYLNFGLLNFVDSDDELAAVLGHEMGHVERRHQITLNAKAQALNLLLGVLSLASPFVYRFGNLIGDLSIYKLSRVDELQADQYGLLLMTRAGYDPDATVSFMERLGKMDAHGGGLDKYFRDHPDPKARIAHLKGYPELSKTNPDQILTQAIHDQDGGRYAYALHKLELVLKGDEQNELALLHKGEIELALGSFDKSELALNGVMHGKKTTAAAHSAAERVMALLPKDPPPGEALLHPNIGPLRKQLDASIAQAKSNQTAIEDKLKAAKDDLKRFNERLDSLSYEVPNLGNVDVRPGSRLESVVNDLEHMAKDINVLVDKAGFFISSAPGMQKDDTGVLNEMLAPLKDAKTSGGTLRLLPFYPELTRQMDASSNGLVEGVTAVRGAVALGWQAMPALDAYLRQLSRTAVDFGGDISPNAAQTLKPLAVAAEEQLDVAANAAEQAQSFYFTAQARQLESRISLLGVGFPEGRYATLTHVIHQRLGIDAPTYDEALRLGVSPGYIATASWLAAEQKVPVSTVINEQRASGKPLIDIALSKHLSEESLEVVLGLWWEGYAEKISE